MLNSTNDGLFDAYISHPFCILVAVHSYFVIVDFTCQNKPSAYPSKKLRFVRSTVNKHEPMEICAYPRNSVQCSVLDLLSFNTSIDNSNEKARMQLCNLLSQYHNGQVLGSNRVINQIQELHFETWEFAGINIITSTPYVKLLSVVNVRRHSMFSHVP